MFISIKGSLTKLKTVLLTVGATSRSLRSLSLISNYKLQFHKQQRHSQPISNSQPFIELPKLASLSSQVEFIFNKYMNETDKSKLAQGSAAIQVKSDIKNLKNFLNNHDFYLKLENVDELKQHYKLFKANPNHGALCLHYFSRFDEELLIKIVENNVIPSESLVSYAIYLIEYEQTKDENSPSIFRLFEKVIASAINIEKLKRANSEDDNQFAKKPSESMQRRVLELYFRASEEHSRCCFSDTITQINDLAKLIGDDLSIQIKALNKLNSSFYRVHSSTCKTTTNNLAIGSHEFMELVKKNTAFIDKSLLIKEFVEDTDQVLLITCPRRWGKTMNMSMIKTFLEIEVNENGERCKDKTQTSNYKLFHGEVNGKKLEKPLIVTEYREFISQHLGEYPVIHIDFKNVKGDDYNTILEELKSAIFEAFEPHEYLISSLTKSYESESSLLKKINAKNGLETLTKIYDGRGENMTIHDMKHSLKYLCKVLNMHFKKKVYVFMDEYDTPINSMLQNKSFKDKDLENTLKLFSAIMGITFKGNAYLEKGLITGILRIAKASLFSALNNLKEYNFLNNEFAKYYGFTEDEVKYLFKEFKISKEYQKLAMSWYDGYRVSSDPSLKLFNTWSMVNFLKHQKIENYWQQSGSVDFIKDLFKIDAIKSTVQSLLFQDVTEDTQLIKVNLNGLNFTYNDFINLKKLLNAVDNHEVNDATVDLFFSFIFAAGYLTICGEYEYRSRTSIKIPNYEVKSELKKQLMKYYIETYKIGTKLINGVTRELETLLNDYQQKETKNLELTLKKLFDAFPEFINIKQGSKDGVHGNEDLIHSVINFTALQIRELSYFGMEEWYKKEGRADIVLINHKFESGMIIELKYNGLASDALKPAEKYIPIFEKYKNIKFIKCLGIAVSKDKKVEIKFKQIENPAFFW